MGTKGGEGVEVLGMGEVKRWCRLIGLRGRMRERGLVGWVGGRRGGMW